MAIATNPVCRVLEKSKVSIMIKCLLKILGMLTYLEWCCTGQSSGALLPHRKKTLKTLISGRVKTKTKIYE